MIRQLVENAPTNTVGVLLSQNSDYFIYVQEILSLSDKYINFIDVFGKKSRRNIDTKFDFFEYSDRSRTEITENELYKEATKGMNRKSVYNLANYMAHGYEIYKVSGVVILRSSNKEDFLFIDKDTGEFWKGSACI